MPAFPCILFLLNAPSILHQDARAKSASEGGHSKCNYTDAKKTVIGGVPDGWVFFKFTGEDDSKKGSVAFCADFPGDDLGGKWEDKTLVLLNGSHLSPPLPAFALAP